MSVVFSSCVTSVSVRASCVAGKSAVLESRGDKADGDDGRWKRWCGSGGGGGLWLAAARFRYFAFEIVKESFFGDREVGLDGSCVIFMCSRAYILD